MCSVLHLDIIEVKIMSTIIEVKSVSIMVVCNNLHPQVYYKINDFNNI